MSGPVRPDGEPIAGQGPDGVSFTEALGAAARRSGFAKVEPGAAPSASALLAAVGGVRGLIEALLPGVVFLVVYTVTRELVPSVIAPVVIAVGFVAARLISRANPMGALAGVVGIALSAGMALFTGRAEDNFVLGFVVNGVSIAVLATSLFVRRPLIGLIVGLLSQELPEWMRERSRVRVATVATLLWIGVFALRLAVQLPLYLAELPQYLAATKLLMGLPLYAAALWVTWLLVRAVTAQAPRVEPSA